MSVNLPYLLYDNRTFADGVFDWAVKFVSPGMPNSKPLRSRLERFGRAVRNAAEASGWGFRVAVGAGPVDGAEGILICVAIEADCAVGERPTFGAVGFWLPDDMARKLPADALDFIAEAEGIAFAVTRPTFASPRLRRGWHGATITLGPPPLLAALPDSMRHLPLDMVALGYVLRSSRQPVPWIDILPDHDGPLVRAVSTPHGSVKVKGTGQRSGNAIRKSGKGRGPVAVWAPAATLSVLLLAGINAALLMMAPPVSAPKPPSTTTQESPAPPSATDAARSIERQDRVLKAFPLDSLLPAFEKLQALSELKGDKLVELAERSKLPLDHIDHLRSAVNDIQRAVQEINSGKPAYFINHPNAQGLPLEIRLNGIAPAVELASSVQRDCEFIKNFYGFAMSAAPIPLGTACLSMTDISFKGQSLRRQ